MPRRVRINEPGFYHIINRGVERRKVFLSKEDKDKFLTIADEQFGIGGVVLHAYVLMDNHYHLLIESSRNNLSDVMRQLNSRYAIYFNKKYNRVGHLWQDRFKSWVIMDESYFFTLFKYFELNPIEAKLTDRFGTYYRTFLSDLLHKRLPMSCGESFLLRYDLKDIFSLLDVELSEVDKEKLRAIQKENRARRSRALQLEQPPIEAYLSKEFATKKERNTMIVNAYKSGVKQSDIAKFFGLSVSSVSKIITHNTKCCNDEDPQTK